MGSKKTRKTFSLDDDVADFIDKVDDRYSTGKSFLVERAVKYYGANVINGEDVDPKMRDEIDKAFNKSK